MGKVRKPGTVGKESKETGNARKADALETDMKLYIRKYVYIMLHVHIA